MWRVKIKRKKITVPWTPLTTWVWWVVAECAETGEVEYLDGPHITKLSAQCFAEQHDGAARSTERSDPTQPR